jgi:hypothetical protein
MVAQSSLVEGELSQRLPPALRERLAGYVAATTPFLDAAPPKQAEAELTTLMLNFHTARSMSKAEAGIVMREYVEALRGLPLWAIRRGIRKFKDGEVEGASLDFPPAAPRLRKVVTEVMEPLMADRQAITRVLAAREPCVEDPEMAEATRKLIGEGLRGAADAMREKDRAFSGPPAASRAAFKPFSIAECAEIYKSRPLPGMPLRNVTRNDDRNGDVTLRNGEHGAGVQ